MVDATRPEAQRKGERKRISPLELFIDLVFVGVIAVVAEDLGPQSDLETLVVVVMAGVMAFLIWFSTTLVFNLFPADHAPRDAREAVWRVIRLLLVFTEMVALLIAALAVQPYAGLSYRDGFWALAIAQVTILLLILAGQRVGRYSPRYAHLTQGLLAVAAVAAVLAAVLPLNRGVLLVLSLIVLFAQLGGALSLCIPDEYQFRMWHLRERFGLLLLISLGEVFITLGFSLRTASEVPYPLLLVAAVVFPMAVFVLYFGVAAPIRTRYPPLWLWAILQCILVMETISAGHQLAYIAGDPSLTPLPWAISGTAIRMAEVLAVIAILCFLGRRVPLAVPITYLIGVAAILIVGFMPASAHAHGVRLAALSGILVVVAIMGVLFMVKLDPGRWRREWGRPHEDAT